VMEDTGMIVPLSEWVLHEACRQGKAWLDAGLNFGRVAVNLSPSEIRRGGVVERLSRILNETGLPPDRLEIEITETGLMESGLGAEQFLQMLHGLGVMLSIDDFGTGYSSLAYLKRFPVHQLKIDRSFIQDLPGNSSDAQLVQTMISLARGLNLDVVAEGVEMPDQEAFLSWVATSPKAICTAARCPRSRSKRCSSKPNKPRPAKKARSFDNGAPQQRQGPRSCLLNSQPPLLCPPCWRPEASTPTA